VSRFELFYSVIFISIAHSLAKAKYQLAEEEAEEQKKGNIALHEMSASVFITSTFILEDQQ
jgi:hypothetical protein